MSKNFLQFFQDGYGAFSSTRLAFLLWAIGVLLVWGYKSLASATPAMTSIDNSVLTVIGILMTGKVTQSFSANDGPHKADAP